mmetsp:Transcript_5677/g.10706  ORF Transcript_5677/g.10706 Transcript_5677/m.10706 type:complete len:257 (+) Transcript_5677:331-1101(+)
MRSWKTNYLGSTLSSCHPKFPHGVVLDAICCSEGHGFDLCVQFLDRQRSIKNMPGCVAAATVSRHNHRTRIIISTLAVVLRRHAVILCHEKLKVLGHRSLELLLFVTFSTKFPAEHGLFHAQLEVENGVGSGEAAVGVRAPLEIQALLGTAEGDPTKGVTVAHDVLASREGFFDAGFRLPPVGGEQQVDRAVVHVNSLGQVRVDHDPDGGGAVGEAHGFGAQGLGQFCGLCRLSASIYALKNDESPTARTGPFFSC